MMICDFLFRSKIDDSTSVIGIVLLMFIIPARPQDLFSGSATNGSGALLDWKFAQSRIPWGLLLLLGKLTLPPPLLFPSE